MTTLSWRVLPVGWTLQDGAAVPLSDDPLSFAAIAVTDTPFRPKAFIAWQSDPVGNVGLIDSITFGVTETLASSPIPAELFQCQPFTLEQFGQQCRPCTSTTLLSVGSWVTDRLDYLTLSRASLGLDWPTLNRDQQTTIRGAFLLGAAFIGEAWEERPN